MKKYKKDDIYYALYKKKYQYDVLQVAPFVCRQKNILMTESNTWEKYREFRGLFDKNLFGMLDANYDNMDDCYYILLPVKRNSNIDISKLYSLSEIILLINDLNLFDTETKYNSGFSMCSKILSNKKVTIDDILKINDIVMKNKEKFGFPYEDSDNKKLYIK